jgi:serine/threonine protein kinase
MVSARSTDTRSDIWSMGVVMYQLLAGRPPFEAETYAQLVLKVGNEPPAPLHIPLPPGLQQIVFRCLEKKPENRIQTVGELARMLAPYASDPLSAHQSAERAYRILNTTRGAPSAFAMSGSAAAGMGLTPVPQLTPKSWNATNGSSLNAGAGQVGTRVVRGGGRGLIIAGVASLCIAAGVGGFVIASSMKKGGGDTKAAAHPTEETTPTTTTTTMPSSTTTPSTAPTGTTPSTTATGTTPTTGSTVPSVPTVDTTKTATTDTTKTDATKSKTDATKTAVKTDATKTAAKDAAKTTSTKTASKSTKTKSTKTKSTSTKSKDTGGGLFDDRK